MHNAILLIGYNRPYYLRDAARAAYTNGFSHHAFLDTPACTDAAEAAGYEVNASSERLGCSQNIIRALRSTLDYDNVVVVEDDIILTPDAVRMLMASLDYYQDAIAAACAYELCVPDRPIHRIGRKQFFTCWGWAIRKRNLESYLQSVEDQIWVRHTNVWDQAFTRWVAGRRCSHPCLSRCDNIGDRDGTHRGSSHPEGGLAGEFNGEYSFT